MDITANRHKGNAESEAANERIAPGKSELRQRIYAYIAAFGPVTCKDVSRELGIGYTTASARISELKAEGRLRPTGERRDGAAMLRAVSEKERQQLTFRMSA